MNKIFLEALRAAKQEQLQRFERAARRLMTAGVKGWGDIWLVVEGELVARELWGEK